MGLPYVSSCSFAFERGRRSDRTRASGRRRTPSSSPRFEIIAKNRASERAFETAPTAGTQAARTSGLLKTDGLRPTWGGTARRTSDPSGGGGGSSRNDSVATRSASPAGTPKKNDSIPSGSQI